MKPGDELPVIREWYELTTWLLPKISKFPRDQKWVRLSRSFARPRYTLNA